MKPIFKRCPHNPIITIKDLPFHAEAVLNPGAAEMDGQVVLLLRVEDTDGISSLYTARSADGIGGWKISKTPLLRGGHPRFKYENWGCEDARITYIADEKQWYITYTAYSPAGAAVGLARTRDFVTVERMGLVLPPNNKDACLFPLRFKTAGPSCSGRTPAGDWRTSGWPIRRT